MGFKKCPRCELNYMNDTDKYCKICMREVRGEEIKEEIETCTVCNESPAIPGKDVCLFCLKEMNEGGEKDEEIASTDDRASIDAVGSLDDDMIPEIDEDIPEAEYREISDDLSLEELEEDENRDDSDDEDDE